MMESSSATAESGPRASRQKNNPTIPSALIAATIFLSAFLLFQVQPLIAKLILPWFGGSAAVWTSCMLFFQVTLLGGYSYAHWVSSRSGARQTVIHLSLLAASLLLLPILPSPFWKPQGLEDPLLRILGLLAATVGIPYFLLSSTSPLLQSWYSRSAGGAMPYRFFALSNAGSLLGLLTYPVLVEPNLTNGQQAWMWSITYVAFVLTCATVVWRSRGYRTEPPAAGREGTPPSWADRFTWIGLAASASALLLSVTNHLTQNVAAIPFLWVLPLSLYLLSFILCFDSDRWYKRRIFACLAAVALPCLAVAITRAGNIQNLRLALAFFCISLFILFMVCHGELAYRRPAPAYLTSFYLMVSVGGAIGGLSIAFAAPFFLNALYDLPVVVCLTSFLLVYLLWRDAGKRSGGLPDAPRNRRVSSIVYGVLAFTLTLWAAVRFLGSPPGIRGASLREAFQDAIMFVIPAWLLWQRRNWASRGVGVIAVAAGMAAGIAGLLAIDTWHSVGRSRVLVRNFYGALRVFDQATDATMGPARILQHGTILHGQEFLWPAHERFPTTYFSSESGVGLAIHFLQTRGPMNVGIVGLGAGTLATYGRPVDRYTIYEINPAVVRIAQKEFRYLRDCMAPVKIVMGDARLSLEREESRQFDLLVVDAFSGDAIPVHLLTREALALYWSHLKPDGVLAVHVSNRYLALAPVVAMGAAERGQQAMLVAHSEEKYGVKSSNWVLVSTRTDFFDQPQIRSVGKEIETIPGLRMWTDNYSNLYKILQ